MEVDGHSVSDLSKSFHFAEHCKDMPTCIVAKTLKGKNMKGGIFL